jgi:hypothetical protein
MLTEPLCSKVHSSVFSSLSYHYRYCKSARPTAGISWYPRCVLGTKRRAAGTLHRFCACFKVRSRKSPGADPGTSGSSRNGKAEIANYHEAQLPYKHIVAAAHRRLSLQSLSGVQNPRYTRLHSSQVFCLGPAVGPPAKWIDERNRC